MTNPENDYFLKVLKDMSTPDEYSSNIARCVILKQRKFFGLKSYDCHLLMQEFIPISIRGSLLEHVSLVLCDLCNLFKGLCSKAFRGGDMELLESRATLILCELEKIFPSSFFTVMVHLIIHLANEAKIAGPVQCRWMYPVERFLKTLKSYVRNKAQTECSITEGYLANECITFCSRYLKDVDTIFNRVSRNYEGNPVDFGEDVRFDRALGRMGNDNEYFNANKRPRHSHTKLNNMELEQVHRYVLFNTNEVDKYRELEAEEEFEASPEKFYIFWKKTPYHVTDISPDHVQLLKHHDGDWDDHGHGSVKSWNYTCEGEAEVFKEKLELDDENLKVTHVGLSGDLFKYYKSYKVILHLTPKGTGTLAKLTIEYEKLSDDMPDAIRYLNFLVQLQKDAEAHLTKP